MGWVCGKFIWAVENADGTSRMNLTCLVRNCAIERAGHEKKLLTGCKMEIVSSAELTITYDGDSVRAGLMDVQELAPALLASGTLIQKANRVLNGEGTHIDVKVRSDFRHGSFLVNLHVDQGLIEQAKAFLSAHPHIRDAKDILEVLFFYAGLPATAIGGLFKLIKTLKNRKPDSVVFENNTGTVILALGDQHFTTNKTTYELYQDPEARRAASMIVAPLENEGIDILEIRRGEEVETVTKDEAPSFSFSEIEGEMLLDNTANAWVSIIALSFNPDHKWRFSTGGSTFTADVTDEESWGRIHKQTIRFSEGDQLLVVLRTTTVRDDKGVLRTRYAIERVLEHRSIPKQSKFEM